MNSFQITVLSIFVVLAILVLVSFAIMLNSKKDSDAEYPTSYSVCPDYWTVEGTKCVMNRTINNGDNSWRNNYDKTNQSGKTPGYDSSGNKVDFNNEGWNNSIYPGVSGRCALKKWANDNNIVWDGVNNYNSAYC
jgi:hypothetical protein